jgi:toxin ParE1/3/4
VRLVWTREAVRDLVEAREYVAKDNPSAAASLASRILLAARKLADHPEMGRRGRLAGTRELVIAGTPYLIPYRVQADRIELLRVLHGRRRYPMEG